MRLLSNRDLKIVHVVYFDLNAAFAMVNSWEFWIICRSYKIVF